MKEDWRETLLNAFGGVSEPPAEVSIPETESAPQELQKEPVRVMMERKGRAGKTATIICGFTVSESELERIASEIKRRLGTGGSARGGEILIQGNRKDDVKAALKAMGIRSKG
ncbi:MAG: translation initiation factor [Muribaculaceae bacterium]|nr:translation initiation factor [Muribaculaceae bacterium]